MLQIPQISPNHLARLNPSPKARRSLKVDKKPEQPEPPRRKSQDEQEIQEVIDQRLKSLEEALFQGNLQRWPKLKEIVTLKFEFSEVMLMDSPSVENERKDELERKKTQRQREIKEKMKETVSIDLFCAYPEDFEKRKRLEAEKKGEILAQMREDSFFSEDD